MNAGYHLEVPRHIETVSIAQRKHGGAGVHVIARAHAEIKDNAIHRGTHSGALKVQIGRVALRHRLLVVGARLRRGGGDGAVLLLCFGHLSVCQGELDAEWAINSRQDSRRAMGGHAPSCRRSPAWRSTRPSLVAASAIGLARTPRSRPVASRSAPATGPEVFNAHSPRSAGSGCRVGPGSFTPSRSQIRT